MTARREPHIHQVVRLLAQASAIAQRGRLRMAIRHAIGFALTESFRERIKRTGK